VPRPSRPLNLALIRMALPTEDCFKIPAVRYGFRADNVLLPPEKRVGCGR
jgi:hypothetical protein